jgi:hypothetical protein
VSGDGSVAFDHFPDVVGCALAVAGVCVPETLNTSRDLLLLVEQST